MTAARRQPAAAHHSRMRTMAKTTHPVTPAVRVLRAHRIPFEPFTYDYEPHGGTRQAAAVLGIDEHRVVKTLLMVDDAGDPLVVLMHGDREVSTKGLARRLGVKRVDPCPPETAERLTGYRVGGISPFGMRRALPVHVQSSVLALERIAVNGGKRGFMVLIEAAALVRVFDPVEVDVAL